MTFEIVENYKLRKCDYISIRWTNPDGSQGYAFDLRYKGRNRNKDYILESTIYGWHYIVSRDKKTVYNDSHPEEVWDVDNCSGWANVLPD